MPMLWKAGIAILVACLVASMVIAVVKLATTPTEILGAGFHGLPKGYHYEPAEHRSGEP